MVMKMAIASASLITLIAGGMVGLDSFFARKNHLKFLAIRTDQHILFDRLDREQATYRGYEFEYGEDCKEAPQQKREKCGETKGEIDKIKKQIDRIPGEVEQMY